jgi:DNA polymerase-3 subunit alpha
MQYELGVILGTGFVDYFLLVYDVIRFAREQGIAVGPGRGSAAASIVAYCLFITNIDPIAHGLSFERFLNPERVTMPDMDLDFADDRRDEVIRYVTERYGRDRVAQIITFGTMGPRAGVRDVGRVLGMPYPDVDRVAKLVPPMCSKVAKAKEEVTELRQLYDSDDAIRGLLDTVEDLEGVARHASTHAAGVVISRDPLVEHVPLYKVPKSESVTTQYAMASIEKLGLLKMDFLGLRTLTIMERARALIERSTGSALALDDIPLEDPSIYETLSAGDTFGIFQVDGSGFRKLMRELRPTEFKHIVAAGALYRPGPMEHIPEFVARKNGVREVTYDHPALKEVLEETYGIVVYQDQVMRVASLVAGYSMGEADLLRRAMGKKKAAELAKHRSAFIERAGERGTDAPTAEHLFNVIEPFAGYAFNKAHAAAYAMITCQTAYLKANYPVQYMAGYLSAEKENADKVAEAMAECGRLGIKILPPDVNQSDLDFTLEDGGIRFGLSAIKHVGSGAIESLLRSRAERGPFVSLEDLCVRIEAGTINKRVLESLAKCGALDCMGMERRRLVDGVDRIAAFALHVQRAAASGQVSLFGETSAVAPTLQIPVSAAATLDEKIAWEEELLGIAVSHHPVEDLRPVLEAANAVPVGDVTGDRDGQRVAAGGVVRKLRSFSTKDGRPMATFQLADQRASVEIVVFSRSYEQVGPKLADGAMLVVDGKVDAADGRLRILAASVYSIDEVKERPLSLPKPSKRPARTDDGPSKSSDSLAHGMPASPPRRITLELSRTSDRQGDADRILDVYKLLQKYEGVDAVEILVRQGSRVQAISLPNKCTRFCDALLSDLSRTVDNAVLKVDGETVALATSPARDAP